MSKPLDPETEKALEEKVKQRLLELGLLTEITPPLAPEDFPKDRRPVPITGKPVSEIIIEERR